MANEIPKRISKAQGWTLTNNEDGTPTIARIDEPTYKGEYVEPAFKNDAAALRYVIKKAAEGNVKARKAIFAVNFQNFKLQ